jgi:hypothetical protein
MYYYRVLSRVIRIVIKDGFGTGKSAKVTSTGQLVTAPYAYDEVVAKTSAVDNTAVNFYEPKAGEQFVITGILLTADSNVVGSAITYVYEATAEDSTTVSKTILLIDLLKNKNRDVTGLNILVTEGRYINLKASDSDVSAVITGYYIPKVV